VIGIELELGFVRLAVDMDIDGYRDGYLPSSPNSRSHQYYWWHE